MTNVFKKKPSIPKKNIEDRHNPGIKLFGDVRAQETISRRNWQLFSYAMVIIALLAIFVAIQNSHRPVLVPYVVVVDKIGQVQTADIPERVDPTQKSTIKSVQYQLTQFIEATRGVIYDSSYEKRVITKYVRPFLETNSEASRLVVDFFSKNDPFKMGQSNTIEVDVDNPVEQTPTTYELHWFETKKDLTGRFIEKTEWKGFATIDIHEQTLDQLRLNPLGLYIKQLTWQNITGGNSLEKGAR